MTHTLESLLALAETDGGTFAIDEIIGKLLNKEPQLVEWWAWHDDGDGGSIVMSGRNRVEVVDWLAKLPADSRYKHYVPKPFYRYPAYSTSLDVMAKVWQTLTATELVTYDGHLKMANSGSARTQDFEVHLDDYTWSRSATQHAIAFILTKQPL